MFNARRRGSGIALLVLWLAAATAVAAGSGPRLLRSDTGAPVRPEAVEATLASSSLVAELAAGGEVSAYGIELAAQQPSRLLISASSETVVAVIIDGAVQATGIGAIRAGEAALLLIATGERRRVSYDAARLAASLAPAVRAEIEPPLHELAARQARRRWWGYYEPLGINAQAPLPRELEALRRQYLLDPAVVSVRREARGRLEEQRHLAATRFVAAVGGGDRATVAGLLDPSPFVAGDAGWRGTRAAFAERLVRLPLAGTLREATVTALAASPQRFRVAAPGGAWTLTTADRDNMSFVAALEPEAAAAAQAGGFTTDSIRNFARSHAAPVDRLAGVVQAAEQWRAGLVQDPIAWVRGRAPLERAVFTGSLGGLSVPNAYYISWLFRSMLVLPGAALREPVVTYYNPLIDVAIASTWRRIDGSWRLSSAFVFDGMALRDPTIPAWTTVTGSYAEALVAATQAVRATAGRLAPGAVLPPTIASDDLRARVETLRTRLQAFGASESQARAAAMVRTALVSARASTLGLARGSAPTDLELEALDPQARAALVPIAVFDRAGGETALVIGSPFRPELLLFTDFAAGDPPRPQRIGVVNLAAAGTAPTAAAAVSSSGATP